MSQGKQFVRRGRKGKKRKKAWDGINKLKMALFFLSFAAGGFGEGVLLVGRILWVSSLQKARRGVRHARLCHGRLTKEPIYALAWPPLGCGGGGRTKSRRFVVFYFFSLIFSFSRWPARLTRFPLLFLQNAVLFFIGRRV